MPEHAGQGLIYPYGETGLCGVIKSIPDDFQVREQLGFTPSGEGEHLLLYVQKKNLTTFQLIEQLSGALGIHQRQFGYSGLKDKQAITQQWISVQMPGEKNIPSIVDTEHYQVLQRHWHHKKIKVGTHASNIFEIRIREVSGSTEFLDILLEKIRRLGFANYFGSQRFGQQSDNVTRAIQLLNHRHKSKRLSRNKRSLYLSALRSELFNQILSKRIQKNHWELPVDGDLFMLSGSQSIFSQALDDAVIQRYQDADIHSAISLYGQGESRIASQALEIEQDVFNANGDITETLDKQQIQHSYRSSRLMPKDLKVTMNKDDAVLELYVELAKGCYLTTLLKHFINI